MNLYDYPELKEDLEDLIGNDDIPMSIDEFSPAKVEELCKTFLSECSGEFRYDLLMECCETLGHAKGYIYDRVEEIINEMLEQVNVKTCRGDYY